MKYLWYTVVLVIFLSFMGGGGLIYQFMKKEKLKEDLYEANHMNSTLAENLDEASSTSTYYHDQVKELTDMLGSKNEYIKKLLESEGHYKDLAEDRENTIKKMDKNFKKVVKERDIIQASLAAAKWDLIQSQEDYEVLTINYDQTFDELELKDSLYQASQAESMMQKESISSLLNQNEVYLDELSQVKIKSKWEEFDFWIALLLGVFGVIFFIKIENNIVAENNFVNG